MKKIEISNEFSLYDLGRITLKNLFSIFYFLIVGLVLGIIYVSTMMTPEYTASGTVSMRTSANATVLNTITEIAKSTNVAEMALLSLEEDGATLDNGEAITIDYIRSGISATYLSTSLNVTINFVSNEQDSSIKIVNSVLDATVSYANTNYTVIGNNLILGEYASSVVYSGQSKTLIITVAVLLGGILGLGIGLISDLLSGKFLFASDVYSLGLPSFHFLTKKSEDEKTRISNIIRLQNSIESKFIDKTLKTIGFVSLDLKSNVDGLIKNIGIQYASSNLRTLIIDLDMEMPTIHNLFNISCDVNISEIVENKYFQKPAYKKVAENLFVIPAKKHEYPTRVIKHANFEKLLDFIRNDFDIVLFKFSSYESNDSSLISPLFLDCLIVNVLINVSKKKQLISFINNLFVHNFENTFVNICENKANFPEFFKGIKKSNL